MKRRLAVVLAVLLMIPAQPVMAAEALPAGIVEEREDAGYDVTAGDEDSGEDASIGEAKDTQEEGAGVGKDSARDDASSKGKDAAGDDVSGQEKDTAGDDASSEEKDTAGDDVSGKEKDAAGDDASEAEKDTAGDDASGSEKDTAEGNASGKEKDSEEEAVSGDANADTVGTGLENQEAAGEESGENKHVSGDQEASEEKISSGKGTSDGNSGSGNDSSAEEGDLAEGDSGDGQIPDQKESEKNSVAGENPSAGTDHTSGSQHTAKDSGDSRDASDAAKDENPEDEIPEEELADMELLPDDAALASPTNAAKVSKAIPEDEVKFNTGNHTYSVVSREDFMEQELGDAFFEEDGSYTIQIPEENPFFPYEVQFTYEGKTTREWFLTPDDTVEIGGHRFHVSAYFDGTVVTQMSVKVGGNIVVAYPEEKEFTDDGDGTEMLSLLPLEERWLNFDFSAYTPVELTMISLDEIFMGENALGRDDKVLLAHGDDYAVNLADDILDLSYDTYSRSTTYWTMIVGDDDQLAAGNIRYEIEMNVTESRDWLVPTVYRQDSLGNRTRIHVLKDTGYNDGDYDNDYDGDYDDERDMFTYILSEEVGDDEPFYIGLNINDSLFPNKQYADLRIYDGQHGPYTSATEVQLDHDITSRILNVDMTQENAGIRRTINTWRYIIMVTYDSSGNVTGCLPVNLRVRGQDRRNPFDMFLYGEFRDEDGYTTRDDVAPYMSGEETDEEGNITFTLYKGCVVDETYYLCLHSDDEVASAYVGQYASREEAVAAGAEDIKGELFYHQYADSINDWRGFAANFKDGVSITIFMEEGGMNDQDVYHYCIRVEEGTEDTPFSYAHLYVDGLKDENGDFVESYRTDTYEDSYGSRNYITYLVGADTDLTRLAPVFHTSEGANVYASGNDTPEVSGETYHDFSKGPVQYTVSAANGVNSRNYWLQVVKVGSGTGELYINSLSDERSNTRVEDGVTYSTREMFMSRYGGEHDILLINIGKDPIPAISAELVSDQVELDDYWTLKGEYPLLGIDTAGDASSLETGELWNQAKLRIRVKDGVESGSDISGTLTIRSGNTVLMVLNLTGYVGGPGITTTDIPQAVKYVPYATMIQNNNRYTWNKTSYTITSGTLPSGMEMKPNGELYGIPTEAGEFTFTVRLDNDYSSFTSHRKTFTLTVKENLDADVEASADPGYELTQRVQNMSLNATGDQTLVSRGNYDEFVALYLDGEKLTEGTDYTSEPGSTRITIRGETLKRSNTPGKHTLGLEFRTKDNNTLKRVAQNYEVTAASSVSDQTRSGGGSDGSGSTTSLIRDPKKGYMNTSSGIITGTGEGYSSWQQDENGWKLIYADGTAAAGSMAEQPDGTSVEQVIWEKVNGAWYAFGINGYLKSGWIFDYQLESWYCASEDAGMLSGWYKDAQDGFFYYMDPATGKLAAGWKQIEGKWYYFNAISVSPTYVFDEKTGTWFYNTLSRRKPYGAMYQNEQTPDGYTVDADGVWDGQTR